MTSYQANFPSHHTRDRHVGFPFAWEGVGKSNKIFHNFLFTSYHITKLQMSGKNITIHTWWKLQIIPWCKPQAFVVFLHTALYERKPRDVATPWARKCVPLRANPLYCIINVYKFMELPICSVLWQLRVSADRYITEMAGMIITLSGSSSQEEHLFI